MYPSNAPLYLLPQVYQLISRRRFQQMEVLEGQNILVTISGKKNRVRVYYLSWLKSKILRTDGLSDVSYLNCQVSHSTNNSIRFQLQQVERRNGWINVGDLQGAVHFKIVKYERIKFLVIALKDSIEIYAWAPKPYHKFMAFKVGLRKSLSKFSSHGFYFIEFWWTGTSPAFGRSHHWGSVETEGDLWLRRGFPCGWFRFSWSIRYLSSQACKLLWWQVS